MALYKRDIGCFQSNVRFNGLERERVKKQIDTEKKEKMRQHTRRQTDVSLA